MHTSSSLTSHFSSFHILPCLVLGWCHCSSSRLWSASPVQGGLLLSDVISLLVVFVDLSSGVSDHLHQRAFLFKLCVPFTQKREYLLRLLFLSDGTEAGDIFSENLSCTFMWIKSTKKLMAYSCIKWGSVEDKILQIQCKRFNFAYLVLWKRLTIMLLKLKGPKTC